MSELDQQVNYTEDNIKTLDWREHIRMRPGMYIGKLGDGSSQDDGIVLNKLSDKNFIIIQIQTKFIINQM